MDTKPPKNPDAVVVKQPDGTKATIKLTPKLTLDKFLAQSFLSPTRVAQALHGVAFPCVNQGCQGAGRIWDPQDPPCPIEGNKLRGRITCPTCKGTGASTKSVFMATFRQAQQQTLGRRQQDIAHAKLLQSALKKLSVDEWKAVRRSY